MQINCCITISTCIFVFWKWLKTSVNLFYSIIYSDNVKLFPYNWQFSLSSLGWFKKYLCSHVDGIILHSVVFSQQMHCYKPIITLLLFPWQMFREVPSLIPLVLTFTAWKCCAMSTEVESFSQYPNCKEEVLFR